MCRKLRPSNHLYSDWGMIFSLKRLTHSFNHWLWTLTTSFKHSLLHTITTRVFQQTIQSITQPHIDSPSNVDSCCILWAPRLHLCWRSAILRHQQAKYSVQRRFFSLAFNDFEYREVSNIRRTKCQNLNDSCLVLQLSVPNPLKPSVKSIMKM